MDLPLEACAAMRTFSKQVRFTKTLEVWNVRAIPAFARSCGAISVTSFSPINIWPRVGLRIALRRLNKDVFPAPFGPIIPRVSLFKTESEIPSRILAPPISSDKSVTRSAEFNSFSLKY